MNILKLLLPILLTLMTIGCAGVNTFHELARAGDTVAVPAGWKQTFTKDSITVEIYPSDWSEANQNQIVYAQSDPRIRGVTNAYIDPLSSMVVSRETGQNLTPSAQTYASTMANFFTGPDRDWWQTLVFVDLPATLPTGITEVYIYTGDSLAPTENVSSLLEITTGTGRPHNFEAAVLGPLYDDQFRSIGRVPHYTVTFSGSTLPHAIQVDLSHDPDANNGGVGKAHVVNALGYVKNVAWNDDGTNMRVIITPARESIIQDMLDFKFYVAGGVTNLAVVSVHAFDINGEEIIPVVTATVD